MTPWRCARCRAAVSPGAPRCPECPSTSFFTEAGMLKISRDGTVSDSVDVRERPGAGEPVTAVEHPADGTVPPETGDDEVPADVQAPDAAPEPAPVPVPAAPKSPPRRPPAVPRE